MTSRKDQPVGRDVHRVTVNPKVHIILEAATDKKPDYEVHGKTRCLSCNRLCWLDEVTLRAVLKGAAAPICIDCATPRILPGEHIGNARDL
jgi:hypothetical protein